MRSMPAIYADTAVWRTEPGLIPDAHHGSYAAEHEAHESNMHVPLASSVVHKSSIAKAITHA
jgi:hypothetical protein